jgi:aminoglycoside phosphotransferase (APT) family kinase protein
VPVWDAEVVIDDAVVRALLREQFPELDASSARLLGEGWDNAVWLVEDEWAFRFPRREIAIPGVRRELVVLPTLAPLVPVRVPAPRFVGEPSGRFPWPFFGAPVLAGCELAAADLDERRLDALAAPLGRFLRALHAPETLAAVDPEETLPVDFNRRADMPFRIERIRERLGELPPSLWEPPHVVDDLLRTAAELPPASDSHVLVHGDLHIRHVLVDGAELSGVIDWGDVCRGDRSIDLPLVWMLFTPAGRTEFFEEYGAVDEAALLRARVLALFLGLILALYARDVGNERLERSSVAALDRTLCE